MSVDPGSVGEHPRTLNLFSYVLGNPFRFTDPDGLVWELVQPEGVSDAAMGEWVGRFEEFCAESKALGVGELVEWAEDPSRVVPVGPPAPGMVRAGEYAKAIPAEYAKGGKPQVMFDLEHGVVSTRGEQISPGTAALHELGEYQKIIETMTEKPELNDLKLMNDPWKSMKDLYHRMIIETYENPVAEKLGEDVRTTDAPSGFPSTECVFCLPGTRDAVVSPDQ